MEGIHFPSMSDLLVESDLEEALRKLPQWEREGDTIKRLFEFDEFMEGIDFVNLLADLAEKAGHHPDIDIRYRRITVSLTTYEVGGLTEADFEMAQRVEHLVA